VRRRLLAVRKVAEPAQGFGVTGVAELRVSNGQAIPVVLRELAPALQYVAENPGGRYPPFSFARPDFDLQEFTSTSVLRREYRPG
jgi:hypothetical protein